MYLDSLLVAQDVIDQSRFAGAEEAGDDRHRQLVLIGHLRERDGAHAVGEGAAEAAGRYGQRRQQLLQQRRRRKQLLLLLRGSSSNTRRS